MRFHQGYFGTTPSGHDLLACAPEQRERFLRILDRTDLQGILPAGIIFDTYVTAFRAGQDFILMRTSLDEKAARAGMVFTHAFIAKASDMSEVPSLRKILEKLESARPKVLDIADIECPNLDDTGSGVPISLPLIHALLTKSTKPAIWPDSGDFINAINVVWQNAWPELRELLTFTMGLSTEDAHLAEYAVVYVPESYVGRWQGFPIISKADSSCDLNAGAVALTGGTDASTLREIAVQVSWPPSNLFSLADLAELRDRVAHASDNPREEIRTLRLMCYFAPSQDSAGDLKQLVLERLQSTFPRATLGDVLACRNLLISCVREQGSFWSELRRRVATLFGSKYDDKHASEYLDFVRWMGREPSSLWRDTVAEGMRRAFTTHIAARAHDIFQWAIDTPSLAALIFSLVPETDEASAVLVEAVPADISEEAVHGLLSALAPRNLPALRAACLATYLCVNDAFDWELSNIATFSALPALASRYSAGIVVSQAVRTEDARLLQIACTAIISNPALLLEADLALPGWQSIVKELREARLIVGHGRDFDRIQAQMIELMRLGSSDVELIAALGGLGFFDLSGYASNANIWNSVPQSALRDFVQASILGTAVKLAENQITLGELAEPLRKYFGDRVSAMACIKKLDQALQIKLFAILTILSEQDFGGWYSALMAQGLMSAKTAKAVGLLIEKRGWRNAAEQVANDYISYRRSDVGPALVFVKPLLGAVLRFRLVFSGVSVSTNDFNSDDLWEQLELILVERFTHGPREHGLWDKSKGHDGDLLIGVSAREQWHYALRLIRDEKNGAPTLERLLEEAKKINGNRYLAWFYENRRQLVMRTKGN
ncbi:MAG TPA: hypothetical protein VFK06_11675 [Candidatus Angelobacter sp.]|nr:hypothetical protein [Candidatus Angelobacter sp.]